MRDQRLRTPDIGSDPINIKVMYGFPVQPADQSDKKQNKAINILLCGVTKNWLKHNYCFVDFYQKMQFSCKMFL